MEQNTIKDKLLSANEKDESMASLNMTEEEEDS
jgi:hypothetical protein